LYRSVFCAGAPSTYTVKEAVALPPAVTVALQVTVVVPIE
jgi:hypothetical protein